MVGLVPAAFAGMPGRFARRGGSDGKVANPDIDANHLFVALKGGISYLQFQGNQEVKTFFPLLILERSLPNASALLDQSDMRVLALVRERDASLQRGEAYLPIRLEGVIALIGIVNGGCNKLRRLIQTLIPLLGDPGEARSGILPDLRPQALVSGRDLAFDTTSQLGRQLIASVFAVRHTCPDASADCCWSYHGRKHSD
jgi:hypothetical protein